MAGEQNYERVVADLRGPRSTGGVAAHDLRELNVGVDRLSEKIARLWDEHRRQQAEWREIADSYKATNAQVETTITWARAEVAKGKQIFAAWQAVKAAPMNTEEGRAALRAFNAARALPTPPCPVVWGVTPSHREARVEDRQIATLRAKLAQLLPWEKPI